MTGQGNHTGQPGGGVGNDCDCLGAVSVLLRIDESSHSETMSSNNICGKRSWLNSRHNSVLENMIPGLACSVYILLLFSGL
jgi:hypothetical protein